METAGEDQVFTLKSADQTYRLMVEEMQAGAATLSHDGVVLYSNPFLAALLDLPVEAVLGAPLSHFLDEQGAISVSRLLQAAESASGVSRGEASFRRGGVSVPTQVSVTLLPLEGAPVFCMIVTDLTERRRREEERAQLEREQLARAAAEEAHRTAQEEIERRKQVEESLRQAEKQRNELLEREQIARAEAEEANRLKDEFLATLSHELRSPLNAIVAWSHILCEPGLDPATASRAVEAIDRNARAQTQLVADILDVSRIVTGKFQLSLGPVRLSDVIESAADTVRPAARAKGIRLELAIDPAAGPVLGDASRLQQVIWNLLSNAIRFAPVGGRVQVRMENAGSCDRALGHGRRPRDRRRVPAVRLRPLPAGRLLEHSPARRAGSRPGHRAAPGRGARRDRRGAESRGPAGRGVDGPAAAAARCLGRRPRPSTRLHARWLGALPGRLPRHGSRPVTWMARCLLSRRTEREANMKGTKLLGAVLLVLGILAVAYGGFSYTKSTDKVNIGPIHLEVKDKETVNIPLWAGLVVAIVGGVLLARKD